MQEKFLELDESIPLDQPLYTDKKPRSNYYNEKPSDRVPYRSKVHTLQRTRSTPLIHADLHENLTRWKSLQAVQVNWPTTYHRYHLNEGIAVQDQDTIVCEARDEATATTAGLHKRSSGKVVYSFQDKQKCHLDAEDIIRILQDGKPTGLYRHWNVAQLDCEFHRRWGRHGVWRKKKLEFCTWLSCFRRTFEVFGQESQYVRLRHPWGRTTLPRVLDRLDDVMVNLARIQNPRLIRYQKMRLWNDKEIKGSDLPGVPEHEFVVDLKAGYNVPHQCLEVEEYEKFGVRLQPRVKEVVDGQEALARQSV